MAQSSGINMTFDFASFGELKAALIKLGDDKDKRSELLKILRRQARPSVSVMSLIAPLREDGRTITNKQGVKYTPGNLSRSIRVFTGKNKTFPSVFVGPQAKKAEGSGYYGFFVAHGTKTHRGGAKAISANIRVKGGRKGGRKVGGGRIGGIVKGKFNFMQETIDVVGEMTQNRILEDTSKYIRKRATQLGFD